MNDFPVSASGPVCIGGNICEGVYGDGINGTSNEFVEPIGKIVGGRTRFVVAGPILNGDLREGRRLHSTAPLIGRRPPDFDLGLILRVPQRRVLRRNFQMKGRRARLGERRELCGVRNRVVKSVVRCLRSGRSCETRSRERQREVPSPIRPRLAMYHACESIKPPITTQVIAANGLYSGAGARDGVPLRAHLSLGGRLLRGRTP
jgi:hypothetical protein